MPLASIVIPTHGRRATLDLCLARLDAQAAALDAFEVLVVVGADTEDPDGVERRVRRALKKRPGRVVRTAGSGASAKRNAGWRTAASEIVLFLDDDVLADPGLVLAHLRVHEHEPGDDVGVLGFLRWAPTVEVTPFMEWLLDGIQFDDRALEGRDETGWWHLFTCNTSLKRAALAKVGGLDEDSFPFLFEDLDLGRRLDEAVGGLRLVLARGATAEHDHTMTLDAWRDRVVAIARAERRFLARWPDARATFHERFSAAAARPQVRGRAARLVPYVPRWLPKYGPMVHMHAQAWWEQELAGPFLASWEAAADERPGPPPQPYAPAQPHAR